MIMLYVINNQYFLFIIICSLPAERCVGAVVSVVSRPAQFKLSITLQVAVLWIWLTLWVTDLTDCINLQLSLRLYQKACSLSLQSKMSNTLQAVLFPSCIQQVIYHILLKLSHSCQEKYQSAVLSFVSIIEMAYYQDGLYIPCCDRLQKCVNDLSLSTMAYIHRPNNPGLHSHTLLHAVCPNTCILALHSFCCCCFCCFETCTNMFDKFQGPWKACQVFAFYKTPITKPVRFLFWQLLMHKKCTSCCILQSCWVVVEFVSRIFVPGAIDPSQSNLPVQKLLLWGLTQWSMLTSFCDFSESLSALGCWPLSAQ